MVIFARFYFSRISRGGLIREFKNLAKIINPIALLKKNENSWILSRNSEIRENLNTRKWPDLQYYIGIYIVMGSVIFGRAMC